MAAGVQAGFQFRGCPKVTPQATWDDERYTGQWHEIIRDKLTWFEYGSGCVIAHYEIRGDKSIQVHNKNVYPLYGWYDLIGSAVESTDPGASLRVSFDDDSMPKADERTNYNVMSTDYDTYSLVYSCEEFYDGFASLDTLWILSRTPELPDEKMIEIISMIYEKLPEYDFWNNYHKTRQGESCPYDTMPVTKKPE